MTLYCLNGISPQIEDPENTWIAESAEVIGKIILKKKASIWFGSVLRGDNDLISIGEGTNIQDMSVVHTDKGIQVSIGKNCTIGHKAIIHGCQIENNCLIGMGSIIMNNAHIGKNSIVGAGSLVTQGKIFPERSLIMGNPARVVRELSDDEVNNILRSAEHYYRNAMHFKQNLKPSISS